MTQKIGGGVLSKYRRLDNYQIIAGLKLNEKFSCYGPVFIEHRPLIFWKK